MLIGPVMDIAQFLIFGVNMAYGVCHGIIEINEPTL
jgi:hypothetical protein